MLVSTPQRCEHNVVEICGALDVMFTRYCGIVQVVDGVLTDDNDAFLYGAKTVYCELSANEKVLHHTTRCIKPKSYKPLMKHNAECSSWHTIQSHCDIVFQELSMSVYSMSTIQQVIGLA